MADAKLSREHALALLHKLAHDDEFRDRFESHPANALLSLGVPPKTVAAFPPASMAPLKLPEKSRFASLHSEVAAAPTSEFRCMSGPNSWFGGAGSDT
ncbi:hypothetical protein MBSD_n0134 [Mizugakiibacter sediminis]|uniref:Uncharacterized protein n=1 Tax=Mizugakiibacter sediminis TaxID=1475481 RepID=A0A0K8QK35_9GAMM|nr:hypothetical protein MBSD_n0134 [Mizugakiibacter sediminis]